ncbi:hypothetical protein F8160_14380 [Bacillus sp. CH126_4D]|uniref:hypothetical protein n=1 Tax=unclassified Bacillus (in: firmicutes) TaxID=185979 RepID=UPI00124C55DF|nr:MULTISPECIES: hypothetical protein [unclassified Bacillus (in: firmicutes)]KAB2451218.1 hypothetical protein F8162_27460 [Bacillus sp. CH140a_4T]KAB2472164.1 hypothetical protein F8160_14380 [Bacillus sp. CH126_4D]
MGFGSDVIEERVSPCGDALFGYGVAGLVVNEIYIGDYRNISAQLKIYQRLFQYIDFPAKNDKYRKPYFEVS